MNKKALIIGGAGFVGGYLARELYARGQTLYITKLVHEKVKLEGIEASVFDLDLLERGQIQDLLNRVQPDMIYHLAAQSSVALSWKNPKLTVDININGTLNLLETLRELDIRPRILLIGSGEEYGHIKKEEVPIIEDNPIRPGNIYAATKACQNMLGNIYARAYGLDIMSVRAFNHIGPNQSPLFVVADFCKQVAEIEAGKKEAIIRVGNLLAKRDFTDVRDVVRAYAMLMEAGVAGETYNVGSGKAIAIDEILKCILKLSQTDIEVYIDEERFRPVDIENIEADITKIRSICDWRPQIALDQTLKETLAYWRKEI